ncbi:MAG: hypothetical protein E5V96_23680 [Mesorhizobium sp.]|nr:MAG: hypothetical protein E5V96_23680 [Mesorhizobium sp.]
MTAKLSTSSSVAPLSVLPDISPSRGEIALSLTASPIADVADASFDADEEKAPRLVTADLPP